MKQKKKTSVFRSKQNITSQSIAVDKQQKKNKPPARNQVAVYMFCKML